MEYLKAELYKLLGKDEKIFELINSHAFEGFCYFDLENIESFYANPKLLTSLGYPASDSGICCLLPSINLTLLSGIGGDKAHILEFRNSHGLRVPAECTLQIFHNDQGLVRVLCAIKAFQESNQPNIFSDEANPLHLHSTSDLYSIFIEQAPNAIAMFDTDLRYLAVSHKWLKDYGLQNKQVIGRSHYEIFPEIGDDWKQIHQQCLEGAVNTCSEAPFDRLDGTKQWIAWDVRPWYRSKKVIGGLLMYTADITERKLLDEKLRISEESFRNSFEYAAIGIALVDTSGKWLRVNESLSAMIGYTPSQLMKLTFQDITHPEDLDKDLALLKEVVDGSRDHYQMEKRYFHKKGHLVWVILAVSVVKGANGAPLYFISQITDITERKLAEQKLQSALSKLEGISNASSQVSIISTDVNGLITSFNKGAENLLGYSASELVQKHTPIIFHKPEEVLRQSLAISQLTGKTITGFDVFVDSVKKGQYHEGEWTYVRKDGTQFPVQLVITSIIGADGGIDGFLGIATDIAMLKAAEAEVKALLDVTNDQNKRLLNFAHIVSHNLRSHSGNLKMLLDCIESETDTAERNDMFAMLYTAVDSLQETVEHLNEVVIMNSKVEENMQAVNLKVAVERAVANVHALLLNCNGTILNQVRDNLNVFALPAYLDSILLNLLTNAIKYRFAGRPPVITIEATSQDGFVCFSVSDNGMGLDLKKNASKLFGMYKTFHVNKDARGIGLFITKNQIEAMGGRIEVTSQETVGTVFKVFLKSSVVGINRKAIVETLVK